MEQRNCVSLMAVYSLGSLLALGKAADLCKVVGAVSASVTSMRLLNLLSSLAVTKAQSACTVQCLLSRAFLNGSAERLFSLPFASSFSLSQSQQGHSYSYGFFLDDLSHKT